MNDKMLLSFQREQIRTLQEEKSAALEALDLARELGSFSSLSGSQPSQNDLLREICAKANEMIPFQSAGIYLIDDETQDFFQSIALPENGGGLIEKEVTSLIADQSFAFALQSDGPVFFLDSTKTNYLMLHTLATPYRIRGMFVGMMFQDKDDVLDTIFKLFSILMMSAVNALESCETHHLALTHNQELEKKVQQRTHELADANERLNVTLKGMQTGVAVIEASSHQIVDANPMALEMLGFTLEEIVGKECFDLICTAKRGDCPIMDNGLEENNGECLIERADGIKIPVQKTVSKVMIGGKLHLVENFIDLTEQKKLAGLKEDVERIMRHDLKSPLNGIIGLPDIILMESERLSQQQREILEHIQASGYKLLNMINLSLDLYKMETGTYDYVPSSGDLVAIVRSVFKDLSEHASWKKIKFEFLLDGNPIDDRCFMTIMSEEFLIYSLLSNLLKNAVEASPKDESIILDVVAAPKDTYLRIHNEGTVPVSIRESFFEKYVTEGKNGGTGLGTYSAKLITETMGGSISMNSSRDKGTTINISLPAKIFIMHTDQEISQ